MRNACVGLRFLSIVRVIFSCYRHVFAQRAVQCDTARDIDHDTLVCARE